MGYLDRLTKDADGCGYTDDMGCHWDTRADFIESEVLHFCGCGCPTETRAYVLASLELLSEKGPDGYTEFVQWLNEVRRPAESALFGNDTSAHFMWYWLNHEGFAEHGSCVPGWLTTEGEALLADLRELAAEDAATAGENEEE